MRNIDCQRNSILVFLPVYGCTDSGVHHYADRPIERIQEKQEQIKEYLKNIMAEIALIIRRSE